MQHNAKTPQQATSDTPHRTTATQAPAFSDEALVQRALHHSSHAAEFSPNLVRALSRVVGNRAAQRMVQRAIGPVGLTASGRSLIQRDPSQAGTIANGHSYDKHVVTQAEFPGITSKPQFVTVVSNVMTTPDEVRNLSNGRKAYWKGDTVVIYNPGAGDKGTCFKPTAGKSYFDNLT